MFASVTLNVRAMILDLGGFRAVADLLRSHGFRPASITGIYKWDERQRIPIDRFLQIVHICDVTGRKLRITDYLHAEGNPANG
jgi:hypothetical protein